MSFHHSPKIVTDGLVMCLDAASKKSYSGGGTIWRDLTQNANNFSLVNGTSFSNSNQGSFLLDGNDDVISISNPINIPNTESSSSADIWFNTYTTSGTKQILFVGKDGNSYQIEIRSNMRGFSITIFGPPAIKTTSQLKFSHCGGANKG